jgi:hypothetical protein
LQQTNLLPRLHQTQIQSHNHIHNNNQTQIQYHNHIYNNNQTQNLEENFTNYNTNHKNSKILSHRLTIIDANKKKSNFYTEVNWLDCVAPAPDNMGKGPLCPANADANSHASG